MVLNKIIECPCTDCLCYSVCKHKDFIDMVLECSLIHDYVIRDEGVHPGNPNGRDEVRMKELYRVLKPTGWVVRLTELVNADGVKYNLPFIQWTEEGRNKYDTKTQTEATGYGRWSKQKH